MLNSIEIGTSGLLGFSKQLQTISNNVANLNTPGFKQSQTEFAALFSQGGDQSPTGQSGTQGGGLSNMPAVLNFSAGQINQTGNDLDAAIDGSGFFVLKTAQGELVYTRNGEFKFDAEGILVSRTSGARVQGLGTNGQLQDITLTGMNGNPAKASTTIKLLGGLSTADTTKVLNNVTVTDNAGGSHSLTVEFQNNNAVTPGSWLVTVKDGTTTVGTGEVRFSAGILNPAYASVAFTYNPPNAAPMPLTINMDTNATSAATGASTLSLSSIDGYGVGALTQVSFDSTGHVVMSYSNGQSSKTQQLALATFQSTDVLEAINGNSFRTNDPHSVNYGSAQAGITAIEGGALEGSNVDLSKEFSEIIVAQRGYQASSELISTANEMLETLMQMKR